MTNHSLAELVYSDELLSDVLTRVKSIALVGAAAEPTRAAHYVMKFLLEKGYRVHPVNPKLAGGELLGQKAYASLTDLPETVDMVDIFCNSAAAGPILDEAVACGVKAAWMQLGVRNDEAAQRARAAGVTVIMDRCPKIEYQRLFAARVGQSNQ